MRKLAAFVGLCAMSWVQAAFGEIVIDFTPVTNPISAAIEARPSIAGGGLLIVDFEGNQLIEKYWGNFDRSSRIPIGSATKWLSAGVMMSLVDDGLFNLDRPVGEVLPTFAGQPNGKSEMTVRQMFSHTSGLPGQSPFVNSTSLTFAESVNRIGLFTQMQSDPGEEFRYGAVSMHVAGRMAEVVGGADWLTLFENRIEQPLGVSDVTFDGVGDELNSRIAAGAVTSIETYSRFMTMLAAGGQYNGQQVLSKESVAELLTDQTAFGDPNGAVLDFKPGTIGEYRGYGMGSWIERRNADGQPVEFTSPGGFGTTPWIDLENRYWGVFFVDDQLTTFDPLLDDLRRFTAAELSAVPEPSSSVLLLSVFAYITLKRKRIRQASIIVRKDAKC